MCRSARFQAEINLRGRPDKWEDYPIDVSRHLLEEHIDATNRSHTGSRQAKGIFPDVGFILSQILSLLLLVQLLIITAMGWDNHTLRRLCVLYSGLRQAG